MEFFINIMQLYLSDALRNISNVSIAIVLLSIFISILIYSSKTAGLPPGPWGVPILGYWPFLKNETCYQQFLDLKKKFGDVFSFTVTGQLYINLASLKVLREAHITKSDCFSQRTTSFNIVGIIFGNGVVYLNGKKWAVNRKFFLQQFRERGMTMFKENKSDAMSGTITNTIEELRRNLGKPLDILRILTGNSSRIILQTLFGVSTTVTEDDLKDILIDYRCVTSLATSSNMVLIGSFAKYFIMPFLPNYRQCMKLYKKVQKDYQSLIDDHKESFDNDNIRDVIDSYIKERNDRLSKGDPTAAYFTDETLAASLMQFVGDAVDNVAAFSCFLLKVIVDHPEEQEKIYKELVEVVGEDRNPGLQDKSKLTYTNAFILEALRTLNFFAIFPSLECTKETTVGGYRIPKGAITIINTYTIHNDTQIYEEPEKFNPSRFISRPEKPKAESPVIFGVGKRVCIGESFVMLQAFLFCTAIIKNFHVKQSSDKSFHELLQTLAFDIYVTPRK